MLAQTWNYASTKFYQRRRNIAEPLGKNWNYNHHREPTREVLPPYLGKYWQYLLFLSPNRQAIYDHYSVQVVNGEDAGEIVGTCDLSTVCLKVVMAVHFICFWLKFLSATATVTDRCAGYYHAHNFFAQSINI